MLLHSFMEAKTIRRRILESLSPTKGVVSVIVEPSVLGDLVS
jgi:hypothetical protein